MVLKVALGGQRPVFARIRRFALAFTRLPALHTRMEQQPEQCRTAGLGFKHNSEYFF